MKHGTPLIVPSGWAAVRRAPSVKSFQSNSGLVSDRSWRYRFSGSYQPDFQKRFFSTWRLE
jgi:hypothetical protein